MITREQILKAIEATKEALEELADASYETIPNPGLRCSELDSQLERYHLMLAGLSVPALVAALEPFASVGGIIGALPSQYRPAEAAPLFASMPKAHPTCGDAYRAKEALAAHRKHMEGM